MISNFQRPEDGATPCTKSDTSQVGREGLNVLMQIHVRIPSHGMSAAC